MRPEKLYAKFKTVQIANKFRETFDRCKAELSFSVEGSHSKEEEGEEEGEGKREEETELGEAQRKEGSREDEESRGTLTISHDLVPDNN